MLENLLDLLSTRMRQTVRPERAVVERICLSALADAFGDEWEPTHVMTTISGWRHRDGKRDYLLRLYLTEAADGRTTVEAAATPRMRGHGTLQTEDLRNLMGRIGQ